MKMSTPKSKRKGQNRKRIKNKRDSQHYNGTIHEMSLDGCLSQANQMDIKKLREAFEIQKGLES
jgi:hypothetical protein